MLVVAIVFKPLASRLARVKRFDRGGPLHTLPIARSRPYSSISNGWLDAQKFGFSYPSHIQSLATRGSPNQGSYTGKYVVCTPKPLQENPCKKRLLMSG